MQAVQKFGAEPAAAAAAAQQDEQLERPTWHAQGVQAEEDASLPLVTAEELSEHGRSAQSPWLSIHGTVYDVTSFVDVHPGGKVVLLGAAGSDATAAFGAVHDLSTLMEQVGSGQFHAVGKLAPAAAAVAAVVAAAEEEEEGHVDTAEEDAIPAHVRAAMEGGALAGQTSRNMAAAATPFGDRSAPLGGDVTVRLHVPPSGLLAAAHCTSPWATHGGGNFPHSRGPGARRPVATAADRPDPVPCVYSVPRIRSRRRSWRR